MLCSHRPWYWTHAGLGQHIATWPGVESSSGLTYEAMQTRKMQRYTEQVLHLFNITTEGLGNIKHTLCSAHQSSLVFVP